MRVQRRIAVFCAALCAGCAGAVCARMISANYAVSADGYTSAGSGVQLQASDIALVGTLGQALYSASSGGVYGVRNGLISSLTPAADTLDYAYPYPNPFKASRGSVAITFAKLTAAATIRIYTISGELVRTIEKSSADDKAGWDLRNAAGMRVASGLYLYAIESGSMRKTGKLIVIW